MTELAERTATLFGNDADFHRAWLLYRGMPEFVQEDLEPFDSVRVHVASEADFDAFEAFIGATIPRGSKRTKMTWFPRGAIGTYRDKRYVRRPPLEPKYPLYIVSKGRADPQRTSRALDQLGAREGVRA